MLSILVEKKSAVPNMLTLDRSVENDMGELKKSSRLVPVSVEVEDRL